MRNIVLLAVCIAVAAAAPKSSQRIVGGTDTTIESFPTMLVLLLSRDFINYSLWCGGTILNSRSILTAASCTVGFYPEQWRARVGSTYAGRGGVLHNVITTFNHQQFGFGNNNNDISVLRLGSTITFNAQARAVSLAGVNYDVAPGTSVTIAGWGWISQTGPYASQLRKLDIQILNREVCLERYGSVHVFTATMMCAGFLDVDDKGDCLADAGGPLYHENVQYGIITYVPGAPCGLARYPGVYTIIPQFIDWIQARA